MCKGALSLIHKEMQILSNEIISHPLEGAQSL